jgi:RNase P subunit RPR2
MDKEEYRPRLSLEEYNIILKHRKKPEINEIEQIKKPNILIFDLETSPISAWVWNMWKQNIQPTHIVSDWFCLTWSAKWLFEPEIYSGKITPDEVKKQDDSRIIKEIWHFIDQADVIIAHNCKKFDEKRLKTRFLLNGLNQPMPYQVIDTLEVAKKQFAFSHNRLDYINKLLGVGRKLETSFELWTNCMAGDQESLDKMEEYNKQDVGILEETYVKLRPYIKSHPNLGLFVDADSAICPTCGSIDLSWKGTYTTTVNKYSSFRCNSCGSIGRSRNTELTKQQKTNVMSPVAR